MVTLYWVQTACLYCLLPVFNSHLKINHSNLTKSNFFEKFNPCLSPEINFVVVFLTNFLCSKWSVMT